MKRYLLFLILITFAVCQISESKREEIRQKRKEFDNEMVKCILNSEGVSENLKKSVEENKDGDLKKSLLSMDGPIEKKDSEIIRNCRIQFFNKLRENFKERLAQHKLIN